MNDDDSFSHYTQQMQRQKSQTAIIAVLVVILSALIMSGAVIWAYNARKTQPVAQSPLKIKKADDAGIDPDQDRQLKALHDDYDRQAKEAEEIQQSALSFDRLYVILIFASLSLSALHFYAVLWTARDARRRGMDGAAVWALFVLFFPAIGLMAYFVARPSGSLMWCINCRNKMLMYGKRCPHCGNSERQIEFS